MIDGVEAFERWLGERGPRWTLPRLFFGTLLVALCWLAGTFAAIMAGLFLFLLLTEPAIVPGNVMDYLPPFLASPAGVLTQLATFGGIWAGVWAAMRFIHRAPLRALFGLAHAIDWKALGKAFAAILIAGIPVEIAFWWMQPGIERGPITLSAWTLILPPLVFLAFVQTSSEELLFRGYLLKALGARFRSPLAWAVLPGLLFTALHFNPEAAPLANGALLLSIALFTVMATILVRQTGNLGAAMGAHLGNNFAGFALIAHESSLNGLALFQGLNLEDLAWTPALAARIVALAAFGCALTLLILLHPRSPLRVEGDGGA